MNLRKTLKLRKFKQLSVQLKNAVNSILLSRKRMNKKRGGARRK